MPTTSFASWKSLCLTALLGLTTACGRETPPETQQPTTDTCTNDTLCLTVKPVTSGTPRQGRLVVAWYLPAAGSSNELRIAYDKPFDRTKSQLVIPLADIQPIDAGHLMCTRTCTEPATCACQADSPRMGLALVALVSDADSNGSIQLEEMGADQNIIGFAQIALVSSEQRWTHFSSPYQDFGKFFTQGVAPGVQPYPYIPGENGRTALGAPAPGQFHDLDVCVEGPQTCTLAMPNIG
jgi:hypothetical protein